MYPLAVLKVRFEEKYIPEPNTGCWLWTHYLDEKGYGYLRVSRERMIQAHRVGYLIYKGVVPQGLVLDHLCRTPCCVNPDHLEPVTHRVNILRGVGTGAQFARRTHCSAGHFLSADNTAPGLAERHRRCLTCRRAADKLRGSRYVKKSERFACE